MPTTAQHPLLMPMLAPMQGAGSAPLPPPQGSVGMAVHRRRRRGGGVTPMSPPPPSPDQRDHRGKERSLPSGTSDWAFFGTQTFGSQTPPSPPL